MVYSPWLEYYTTLSWKGLPGPICESEMWSIGTLVLERQWQTKRDLLDFHLDFPVKLPQLQLRDGPERPDSAAGSILKLFSLSLMKGQKTRSVHPGNTKGGNITVPLTSCLTGLESAVCQLTIFVFICRTDYTKPVKQEVNNTVILPPLVFPGSSLKFFSLV